MLEDLDFMNGDPGELRGRAILFVSNATGTENPFNPRFPALAVASDPSVLLEMLSKITPLPDALRDTLLKQIKQYGEMWSQTMFGQSMFRHIREQLDQGLEQMQVPEEYKEQLRDKIDELPDEPTGVPFHGCFLPLMGFDPDGLEPYEDSCDIARGIEIPGISYAGLVLTGYAQHYLASYLLQRERAAPAIAESGKEEPEARVLSASEFLQLLNRRVSELMYARETGQPLESYIRELQRLARGTVFIRDVLNLARFAETTHPYRIAIIDLYLRRVTLLSQERYEEIPEIDREIKRLVESGDEAGEKS